MDQLMHRLAPKSAIGFVLRLLFLTALVAVANITFAILSDNQGLHEIGHSIAHAAIVGGPFITFFLAVSFYQVRLQRRLSRLSRKDGLTGLNNRRTFFERAIRIRAETAKGVLLVLDADSFKQINDTYGHLTGDKCLKAIAYTLKRSVRPTDVVGRIGGEEFAIYLPGATVAHARVIGERLTKPIAFEASAARVQSVTLSVGAAASHPELSIDDLFASADRALYRAKRNGKAAFVLWEEIAEPSPGAAAC